MLYLLQGFQTPKTPILFLSITTQTFFRVKKIKLNPFTQIGHMKYFYPSTFCSVQKSRKEMQAF